MLVILLNINQQCVQLCFKISDNEILILGGSTDNEITSHYYIFDVKKLIMIKKSEKPLLKEADEFVN